MGLDEIATEARSVRIDPSLFQHPEEWNLWDQLIGLINETAQNKMMTYREQWVTLWRLGVSPPVDG